MSQLADEIQPDMPLKAKAIITVGLFQPIAEKRNIKLKLNKKERTK
jgi:ribosomal protein S16